MLLIIVLFFAPLAKYIPKSFLAGVLMFVAWKMVNIDEFKTIMRLSRKDTLVLFATFFLTIFTDLVFAVQVGLLMTIGLLFYRMTSLVGIQPMEQYPKDSGINKRMAASKLLKENVGVYTIHGPFFFGALSVFDKKINEQIRMEKPIIVLRMKNVPFIDSTGAERLKKFIEDKHREGSEVYLTTMRWRVRDVLKKDPHFRSLINKRFIFEHTQEALDHIEKKLKGKTLDGKK